MKSSIAVRLVFGAENAVARRRAFLFPPDKNRICPHISICTGSFRGSGVLIKREERHFHALVRPLTDILCENLPAFAATSRFIAYQTCLFYHTFSHIAIVLRNFGLFVFVEFQRTFSSFFVHNAHKTSRFFVLKPKSPVFPLLFCVAFPIFTVCSHLCIILYVIFTAFCQRRQ